MKVGYTSFSQILNMEPRLIVICRLAEEDGQYDLIIYYFTNKEEVMYFD